MASIDKIYGTNQQFREMRGWLEMNRPDLLQHLYYGDYEDIKIRPISNFPEEADRWLFEHCPLAFIHEAIREQYGLRKEETFADLDAYEEEANQDTMYNGYHDDDSLCVEVNCTQNHGMFPPPTRHENIAADIRAVLADKELVQEIFDALMHTEFEV